ncbi:hypothetical protein H310_06256 [Aphanomyces invadans]|uniref:L-type lectin-like domain-containing protein n=1 Tax=Aphanomyces invadans TaxID=157072 RepID=A0A024U5S7_9STRA|nr:hypothetical protein H310_06256 [Aphanomyces invadans]ETW01624.1 hypothetical protein H310_06256 [Aphanomyces invadans]|eukprot:XP_008869472.1 hypothetical protein H310_06256 [Aphanomyces invadans]
MRVLAAFLALAAAAVWGAKVPSLSFEKPFEDITSDGVRIVSDDFTFGGHTVVNKHFVRLTTDRQSKRGFVWSKATLGSAGLTKQEFSIVLTFRISGQGERWFGDGLALWVTTEPRHSDGENHGFKEKYTGIGIIVDTFVNDEQAGGHKDVTFVVNDGTKSLDDINYSPDGKKGCDAKNMRYHAKSATFSASGSMSRVKLSFSNNYVNVHIDPTNSGFWSPCYEDTIQMPSTWLSQATLGVTASTGSLADTHDLIALEFYDTMHDEAILQKDYATVAEKAPPASTDHIEDKDERNLIKIKELQRLYDQMVEDFEHEYQALKEETANTVGKLRQQEQDDLRRIEQLEEWVNSRVDEKVGSKVQEIEETVDKSLKSKLEETEVSSGGWKIPFVILVLVLGGGVAFAYTKYQELRKSHLL